MYNIYIFINRKLNYKNWNAFSNIFIKWIIYARLILFNIIGLAFSICYYKNLLDNRLSKQWGLFILLSENVWIIYLLLNFLLALMKDFYNY